MRDEERYRAIVESVPDGVCVTDADDRITYANPALGRMLGVDPGELIGRTPADFVAADGRENVADALLRRRQGVTERYEVTILAAGGGELVAEVSATPQFDTDGAYQGSIAVMVDASERRSLEERLQQAQRLETVGQLAGGIAHDFNNILAVILNYAHFVRSQLPEDDSLRDDLDQIRHAAERASELTRQLLIFGRRDASVPQTVDVNALVRATEVLLRRPLGEQVVLTTSLCEDRCFVKADPAQLENVLLNLVVNARDAMPGGGSIEIASAREGESVVVSVRDDGMGMEPDVAAHALEPFFTTKPKGAGTGLGLATVYGTVTAAGGEVQIESRPGAGTTVRLVLPAADGAGATVLLVEDEAAVRELTRRILAEGGYECLTAADAGEALALFEANRDSIDVILTDVVMPGLSGPELVERLGDGAPPAVYMSGYADQRLEKVVEKPFDADALLRAVSAAREGQ
jgi:PAS domain S-box-containing protein